MSTDFLDGVLLINKPHAITSHGVVAALRRSLGIKKIGHAGTLDPMATGLLIVLVGRATKISQYLIGLPKCYDGTMKLGISTDSHDSDGVITKICEVGNITLDNVENTARGFLGDQYQMPPMFSAKKVNGRKLCDLARKGKDVERSPQFIRVDAFEIRDFRGDEIDFYVHCSKGTYVRTLANDFGERLQCGAHLSRLRRTEIENFSLEMAFPLDEIVEMPPMEVARRLIPSYAAVPSRVVRV
ncbi:MAG: tRNA pseudouridine(55) synthase TruB [Puniceicoccales bacterium]|nr:tRNA pseudouridine(55) synthase TruB [Puniceicoccales bacterium]